MKFRKTTKRIALAALALLVVQVITYNLFAFRQLKHQLLTGPFGALSHSADSVFIRDFYVTDCGNTVGIYTSHHLKNNEEVLKEKLNVKFIRFQDEKDHSWDNPEEKNYRLIYHTWVHHNPWALYDLFGAIQTEELIIDKAYYRKETSFRWFLFFWTKPYEFLLVR
jgi:hypothetical protein